MSKQVTISVQGSTPYVKEVSDSMTVGELQASLNLDGYSVTNKLDSVDGEDELENFGYYIFTKSVKGA